jgi:hypothetical protein
MVMPGTKKTHRSYVWAYATSQFSDLAAVVYDFSPAQRDLMPEGSVISRALDYSLKCWAALSRYLDNGAVPIDKNWAENQIRPWALGRKNWLFAGS